VPGRGSSFLPRPFVALLTAGQAASLIIHDLVAQSAAKWTAGCDGIQGGGGDGAADPLAHRALSRDR
jgi:hypothetical protein